MQNTPIGVFLQYVLHSLKSLPLLHHCSSFPHTSSRVARFNVIFMGQANGFDDRIRMANQVHYEATDNSKYPHIPVRGDTNRGKLILTFYAPALNERKGPALSEPKSYTLSL